MCDYLQRDCEGKCAGGGEEIRFKEKVLNPDKFAVPPRLLGGL